MLNTQTAGNAIEKVSPGHYAVKQIFSRSAVIAWSHRNRFHLARHLLEPHAGKRLVDYGCGDGTLLAAISDNFPDAMGVDPDLEQIDDCRRRFARLPRIRFLTVEEIANTEHDAVYDVAVCMEVLEHCVDVEVEKVIGDLIRLVVPGGTVIISVPVEIGPALLGKHLMRVLASWRSLDDYKSRERYTVGELLRSVSATERTSILREVYISSRGPFHNHKGFNWRALRTRLRTSFEVRATHFSPLEFFRGLCSSQVWFVCKRRLDRAE